MKKLLFILPIIVFAFVACNDDDDDVDTTKPTIDIKKPANETEFHLGDKIEFECNFTDNVELASYKVDIHNNFDDHTHEHSAQLKSESEEEEGHPWEYIKEGSLEGASDEVTLEITIPETVVHDGNEEEVAAGHYHLGVFCLDKAGNENVVWIEIDIEHEDHEH